MDPRVARLVTGLAVGAALLVAVMPPAATFIAGYATVRAHGEARVEIAASIVSQFVMRSPQLWRYEEARLRGQLAQMDAVEAPESWRVFDSDGLLAAARGEPEVAWPRVTVGHQIYDAGLPAGRIEVVHSLRGVALRSALVALLSALFGGLTFMALRTLPLRLLARAMAEARHLATHDPLTGLPNRALFRDRLVQAMARARRDGATVAVLCLDIDHFKEVNETLGHAAGDRLLQAVAQRLADSLAESDTFARLGADEFAVLQTGARRPEEIARLAERLAASMARPFDLDGQPVTIGLSIGATLRCCRTVAEPGMDCSPDVLLQEADVALRRSKAEGRGAHRFFQTEMARQLQERRSLEADLRQALAEGQFRLHYQPQVCLATRRITGAEALIRWRHPLRGDVPPDRFIPLAEENGLILPIGAWVLHEACREAAGWPLPLRVAVNVSPAQFHQPGLVLEVQRVLRETGLAAGRLELEVTEGVLLSETEQTLESLRQLRGLGVHIALDDFGSGYSSLGYLRKFAFDKLKIDRAFIRRLREDAQSRAIVAAVLQIGHALGMQVTAEGVEEESQAELLHQHGCEQIQGFLCAPALPPAAFLALAQGRLAERPGWQTARPRLGSLTA